ncbi:hypothetical protein QYE76_012369 [Lolium multiflorum]|uniref:MLO-like protein n=1 Tax=Lolium multiflorum TaxID=4521 RepID=A0AAD8X681_LOLMU|nr:hypothetical protein QYE76_012369 [Lolium multiflorum]
MTLGFISLLLTITARYISRICIPEGAADTMLPCRLSRNSEHQKPKAHGRRHLSEAPTNYTCRKGMVSLVSADGLHQLHIFVFVLAVFHVTFSAITMSLGRAKTRIWKEWENDTSSITYEFSSDPSKFRLTHQTSFVRQHASCWSKSTIMLYVVILAIGTKLLAIIARMAVEITERHTVIQGMPVVKLSDEHFWFGKPQMVLHLIHFALFQNAFEITYFFWIWYEFGLRSCFHENFEFIIARVCLGAVVQFVCSYITLPLHALVSQMGSQMKRTIFEEQTAKALKKWHKAVVKKKHQQQKESAHAPSETATTDTTEASRLSQCQFVEVAPVQRHLHRYKTIAHVGATRPLSDSDCSDTDGETQTRYLIPPRKQRSLDSEVRVDVDAATSDHHDSFSFPRLPHSQNVPRNDQPLVGRD